MGAGCSNRPATVSKKDTEKKLNSKLSGKSFKRNNYSIPLSSTSKYQKYKYKNDNEKESNLIIFTQMVNYINDFYVLNEENKGTSYSSIYKSKGIAVGYCKGYKLDVFNQDKFFVLLDGGIEIYCVLDGHGPYGNIIAQILQDNIFQTFHEIVCEDRFEIDYDKLIRNAFIKLNDFIIKREDLKYHDEYDSFLSGSAVTVIIKKDNAIYSANVGNVSAFLLSSDREQSYKYKIIGLTLDDSDFAVNSLISQTNSFVKTISLENKNKTNAQNSKENFFDHKEPQSNIHENYDIKEELRRIYESGGEIRKLAGEDKSRIFVKGKYFPGLINTRSIGDQIGSSIGIISTPHISKLNFDDGLCYLVIATDGIRNVLTAENIISIIENSDVFCKLSRLLFLVPIESITNIIEAAKQEYKKSSYCPDMTIVLKTFNKYI